MKKKKGFTLIELLAVIIILAIIALIASPLIMNIINDSRLSSMKIEAESLVNAAELYIGNDKLDDNYKIIYNTNIYDEIIMNKEKLGAGDSNPELYINDKNQISLAVYENGYCFTKDFESSNIKYNEISMEDCFVEGYITFEKYNLVSANDFKTRVSSTKYRKIIFEYVEEIPDTYHMDLSMEQNKTIVSVIENDIIYVRSTGQIIAPSSLKDMFSNYNNYNPGPLETIEFGYLPNDAPIFDTSNVTNMENMFRGLKNITAIDLSSFNTEKVIDMDYMFYLNSNLETLDLSSFNTNSLQTMSSMFSNMSNLKSLNLTSFNTSNVTNMGYLFHNNTSLESIDLSSFNTEKVTEMSSMFRNTSMLKNINLSSFKLTSNPKLDNMFEDASAIIELDLSTFDLTNNIYYGRIFVNATNLSKVYVRSQIEIDKLKSTWGVPSGITYIIK